jgi:hypothetical protein
MTERMSIFGIVRFIRELMAMTLTVSQWCMLRASSLIDSSHGWILWQRLEGSSSKYMNNVPKQLTCQIIPIFYISSKYKRFELKTFLVRD